MNSHIEKFFNSVEQKLPSEDLLPAKSLVEAGIAKSASTLSRWRHHGNGPAYIKLSKGQIRYIRSSVLEWLRQTHQPMLPFMYLNTKKEENSHEL